MHTKYFHSISIACRRSSSSLFVLSLALFTANLLHFNAMDEVKTLCSDHDERDSNEVKKKRAKCEWWKYEAEKCFRETRKFFNFFSSSDRFSLQRWSLHRAPSKGFTRCICFYFYPKTDWTQYREHMHTYNSRNYYQFWFLTTHILFSTPNIKWW